MIFASDLDRTLIYSSKFISGIEDMLEIVEYKGEKPISYFLTELKRSLENVNKNAMFIPVTTRTKKQYDRIHMLKDEIVPKYHVTTNGARIFIDGEECREWKGHIEKSSKESFSIDEAHVLFEKMASDIEMKELRSAEDVFLYCVLDHENIDSKWKADFADKMRSGGWEVSHQGRKLYAVPKSINKRDAVKFIADRENIKDIISAGDSNLDFCMSEISKLFLIPKHGELVSKTDENHKNIVITKAEGVFSALEILNKIESYF